MKQNSQHSDNLGPKKRPTTPLYAVPDPGETRPQKIKVSSPEDVLAYIQCTLGFKPKNSLVVVAFAENQLSTVVRCDLPEPLQHLLKSDTPASVTFLDFGLTETQELQLIEVGRHIGRLMAQEPSTTSCLMLYLADQVTVSDHRALSATGTANSIVAAQFGLQGVRVEEAWLIHHSLLWHLRCASTTECDVQGNAVANPEETSIFQSLDPSRLSAQPPSADRSLTLPSGAAAVAPDLPDTQDLFQHRPQIVSNWLNLWDELLSNSPRMLHTAQVAEFLDSLEYARVRETVLALACFDFSTAVRGMVGLGQLPTAVASAAQLSTSISDTTTVKGCLRGESERSPNWQRIRQLERLCLQLLPLSDARSGGVVAGILVWIEWIRGRGSIAMTYAKQARRRFPAEYFLITLEEFLRQGLVAGWATRVESAWSPQHAA